MFGIKLENTFFLYIGICLFIISMFYIFLQNVIVINNIFEKNILFITIIF